jgi:hypothetical protein
MATMVYGFQLKWNCLVFLIFLLEIRIAQVYGFQLMKLFSVSDFFLLEIRIVTHVYGFQLKCFLLSCLPTNLESFILVLFKRNKLKLVAFYMYFTHKIIF